MVTEADKTNTGVVATIVVVGAFAMISISALLTAMVRSEEADVDAVRPTHADLGTIAALEQAEQQSLHAAPHWADKEARRVSIPIDNAMKLVVAELRKDPELASPPVPPGVVLPPAPPAVGAAPAAVEAGSTGAENPIAAPAAGAAVPAAGAVPPHQEPVHEEPVNTAPPTGAAPSPAPGPAAPGTPSVPPSRKLR